MKNVRITLEIYNCVKVLLQAGSPPSEIAEYLKLNPETVRRINRSDTFQDYKAAATATRLAYEARKKTTKADVTPAEKPAEKPAEPGPATKPAVMQVTVPWDIRQILNKQNELLTLISDKLAYIVQQLT